MVMTKEVSKPDYGTFYWHLHLSVWLDVTANHTRHRTWGNCSVSTPAQCNQPGLSPSLRSGREYVCTCLCLSPHHTHPLLTRRHVTGKPQSLNVGDAVSHTRSVTSPQPLLTSSLIGFKKKKKNQLWVTLMQKKHPKKQLQPVTFFSSLRQADFVVSKRGSTSWQEISFGSVKSLAPLLVKSKQQKTYSFKEQGYHITTCWTLYPERRKRKKLCL